MLILFDIDGTLLTTYGAGMRALERAVQQVLGVTFEASGIRPDGSTDPLLVRELLRRQKIAGSEWPRVEAEIWPWFEEFTQEELATAQRLIYPGVEELLEELFVTPGVGLGLLTGNLESTARMKLDLFGLNRYFPTGAFASDCADRCRLARIAVERGRRHYAQDYRAEHVWVIGDTPRDVEAGRAVGARSIAVATGSYGVEILQEHMPTHALKDLSDTRGVIELLLGKR